MNAQSTKSLHTGNEMPVLGIGTWQLTNDTPGIIVYALGQGYRMIDTSGDYGTQPGIAEGIQKSDVDRSELYIVTKVEETEDAYESTQKNIGELQIEYADLMLIHRPPKEGSGKELWDGLIRAREDGLTKDIGVSNYATEQIDALVEATGVVPTVNQIEWTPFGYSEDMLSYTQENNIIIQAYSPLTRTEHFGNEILESLAKRYDKTPAQILIRWNLERGTVPLPKANNRKHMEENINVFDFRIDDKDIDTLNNLNQHYSSLGSLPYV